METFHITVINNDGQTVLNGNMSSVPRIGEKIISNGYRFMVKDVVYDFGYNTHYGPINVVVHVCLT